MLAGGLSSRQILQWYGMILTAMSFLMLIMPEKVFEMHQVPSPNESDKQAIYDRMQLFATTQAGIGGGLLLTCRANDAGAIAKVSKFMKWGFTIMIAVNMYTTFGGLAAQVWGKDFTQMDAMGLHAWSVLGAVLAASLCMAKDGDAKIGKAPKNTDLKSAFKVNEVPLQYTCLRIVVLMCTGYALAMFFAQDELDKAYGMKPSTSPMYRMLTLGWAQALLQNSCVIVGILESHSAKTIYRTTRFSMIWYYAMIFFIGGALSSAKSEEQATAMRAQCFLYLFLFFMCRHAIEGKSQKGW